MPFDKCQLTESIHLSETITLKSLKKLSQTYILKLLKSKEFRNKLLMN